MLENPIKSHFNVHKTPNYALLLLLTFIVGGVGVNNWFHYTGRVSKFDFAIWWGVKKVTSNIIMVVSLIKQHIFKVSFTLFTFFITRVKHQSSNHFKPSRKYIMF